MKNSHRYVSFVFALLFVLGMSAGGATGAEDTIAQGEALNRTAGETQHNSGGTIEVLMQEEMEALGQSQEAPSAVIGQEEISPMGAEVMSEEAAGILQPGQEPSPLSQGQKKPHTISLDIKGMDIVDVLKLISKEGDIDIIAGKNVAGKVSMFLKDVDVWDAFEIIVVANGLAYDKKGEIVNVMNARDYEVMHGKAFDDKKILKTYKLQYADAEKLSASLAQIKSPLGKVLVDEASNSLIVLDVPDAIADIERVIRETDTMTEPLQTKVFELNYAESGKITEKLQEILTKERGIIKTDERSNKLVVIDYPSKLSQIEQIIDAFDEKTRQVLIEAKIVQVTLSDAYKMGIDWKYIASQDVTLTAFDVSRALNTQGGQLVAGTATPVATEDYRLIFDMLKTFGDVKTLSTPRITATDGQEARILVGSKEVYVSDTVVQGDTTQTIAENINFVDVGVKLYVTPTINNDGFIAMKIRPEVSSTDSEFTKQDGTKIPIVSTSEAETSVIIKDGVTIVMGGLMKDERTKNVYKLPLIGEVPFLGALFRRTEDTSTKTELVIFLTPHIISGDEPLLEVDQNVFESAR